MGVAPWNKGKTYEELKGKGWSDEFKEKCSVSKRGKKLKHKRKISQQDMSYKYFRKLCKTPLYDSWVKPVLERDGYSCTKCGATKELEVHHLIPYKTILEETTKSLGLRLNEYQSFSDEEFDRLRDLLIKNHTLDMGVTLCKWCHMEVDEFRRKFHEKEVHDVLSERS